MDEEMEETIELTFTAVEIDIDYEFDAVRFFDFSREESRAEAREAELWFESAGSYPPSPFASRLLMREEVLENVNTSPKGKDAESIPLPDSDSDTGMGEDFSVIHANDRDCEGKDGGVLTNLKSGNLQISESRPQQLPTGLTFYNHMTKDNPKAKTKCTMKPTFPRPSTLMKPTVSQLAKQNRPCQVGDFRFFVIVPDKSEIYYSSSTWRPESPASSIPVLFKYHDLGTPNVRFQKVLVTNIETTSNNPCGTESQAAKRQKLEGGHLRKVADTTQPINLVHKVPKRDGTIDGDLAHCKLKITVPREPGLKTAQRAQKMRPKSSSEEHVTETARRFKALPLNRKILEAPSLLLPKRSTPRLPEFQEFYLKTTERAMQHSSAAFSSSIYSSKLDKVLHKPSCTSITEGGNGESIRPNSVQAPKQEKCETTHNFKARPLNKKIFSSKGDIGVLRNTKRELTVPMEFNFHTEKRVHHNPPIDLFDKLSLGECQSKAGFQLKLPQPTSLPTKGSKENRLASYNQTFEIKHLAKEKLSRFGGKQSQCGTNGGITETVPLSATGRSSGNR